MAISTPENIKKQDQYPFRDQFSLDSLRQIGGEPGAKFVAAVETLVNTRDIPAFNASVGQDVLRVMIGKPQASRLEDIFDPDSGMFRAAQVATVSGGEGFTKIMDASRVVLESPNNRNIAHLNSVTETVNSQLSRKVLGGEVVGAKVKISETVVAWKDVAGGVGDVLGSTVKRLEAATVLFAYNWGPGIVKTVVGVTSVGAIGGTAFLAYEVAPLTMTVLAGSAATMFAAELLARTQLIPAAERARGKISEAKNAIRNVSVKIEGQLASQYDAQNNRTVIEMPKNVSVDLSLRERLKVGVLQLQSVFSRGPVWLRSKVIDFAKNTYDKISNWVKNRNVSRSQSTADVSGNDPKIEVIVAEPVIRATQGSNPSEIVTLSREEQAAIVSAPVVSVGSNVFADPESRHKFQALDALGSEVKAVDTPQVEVPGSESQSVAATNAVDSVAPEAPGDKSRRLIARRNRYKAPVSTYSDVLNANQKGPSKVDVVAESTSSADAVVESIKVELTTAENVQAPVVSETISASGDGKKVVVQKRVANNDRGIFSQQTNSSNLPAFVPGMISERTPVPSLVAQESLKKGFFRAILNGLGFGGDVEAGGTLYQVTPTKKK